jgi:predicted NUDIX family phosphoesterase
MSVSQPRPSSLSEKRDVGAEDFNTVVLEYCYFPEKTSGDHECDSRLKIIIRTCIVKELQTQMQMKQARR